MSEASLELSHITKTWPDGNGTVTVLNDVSLRVYAGEKVALRGASGSGKSTLLNIMGALDTAYNGDVFLNGQKISALTTRSLARIRNTSMGFVFQSHNLLPHLNVTDNVLLPGFLGDAPVHKMRAYELLEAVGLLSKKDRFPHTLSGGERQRVAIARALYNTPQWVLCDEPTGHLDALTSERILQLFDDICTKHTITWIIATHDESVARWTQRSVVLKEGVLVP